MTDMPFCVRGLKADQALRIRSLLAQRLAQQVNQAYLNCLPIDATYVPADPALDLPLQRAHVDLAEYHPWVSYVPALSVMQWMDCFSESEQNYSLAIRQAQSSLLLLESSFEALINVANSDALSVDSGRTDSLFAACLLYLNPLALVEFEHYVRWRAEQAGDFLHILPCLQAAWTTKLDTVPSGAVGARAGSAKSLYLAQGIVPAAAGEIESKILGLLGATQAG
jgi:hypothetical protein